MQEGLLYLNPDHLGEFTVIFQACFNKLHNIYLLTHVLTAVYRKKPFFRKKIVWRKKVKVGHFKTKIVRPIINQKTLASTTTTATTKTTEKPTDNNVIHLAPPVNQPYGQLNMTIGDNPRLLSLFTIVTFPNDACMSGSGGNGTCYRYIG